MNSNLEHCLQYCKVCQNQKFSMQEGIVCGLSNQKPDFYDTCDDFVEDIEKKERAEMMHRDSFVEIHKVNASTRFTNRIIDVIFSYVFVFIAFRALMATGDRFIYRITYAELILLFYAFLIGYYVVFEALLGKTIGKMVTKTKVVNMEGGKPSFLQIVVRSLVRFIPFEPFSFLGADATGWHDTMSDTRVINDEAKF